MLLHMQALEVQTVVDFVEEPEQLHHSACTWVLRDNCVTSLTVVTLVLSAVQEGPGSYMAS